MKIKLLFLIVLAFFFSCTSNPSIETIEDEPDDTTKIVLKDTLEILEQIISEEGDTLDNNGEIKEIRKRSGKLPLKNVIAPISAKAGEKPKIDTIKDRGVVIADRLNITLLEDSISIDSFSVIFSKKFDRKKVEMIAVNRNLLTMQIRVSSEQREKLKSAIIDSMKGWKIEVNEDYLQKKNDYGATRDSKGWHLDALYLKDAWKITKGSPNIVIAIVDDGICGSHLMLRGKIVKPWNVFTQTNNVSKGSGHGTHVASIAAGSAEFYDSDGAAGIAPNCKIMPVQVFDNEYADKMSIISGVWDAIDHGARIVNVSAGTNLTLFSYLTKEEQREAAKVLFKDEEVMWNRVLKYARQKNAIVVFSAGNDNVVASLEPHNRSNYSITVAAVDANNKSTKFTNFDEGTDISAYGEAINGAGMYGNFVMADGTSASAPIVAGTIALMRAIKPTITANEALEIMRKTGLETDRFVPPAVNPYRALKYIQTGKIVKLPNETAQIKNVKFSSSGTIDGHDYVDLGLPSGTLWATCNVGANSPEEYGDYFAWGETETKATYTESNSKWFKVELNTLKNKGVIDKNGNLTSNYDAATKNWGNKWKMPTKEEIKELISLKNKNIVKKGKKGKLFIGKNGNTLFFPFAGCRFWYGQHEDTGNSGDYWSSTVLEYLGYLDGWWEEAHKNTGSASLVMDTELKLLSVNGRDRGCGFPIRPVVAK